MLEQLENYRQMIEFEEDGLKLLRFTDWHSIRDEYFFIAPKAFFNDLIPRADMLRERAARQEQRQKQRLEKMIAELPVDPAPDDATPSTEVDMQRNTANPTKRSDRYGLDLDEF